MPWLDDAGHHERGVVAIAKKTRGLSRVDHDVLVPAASLYKKLLSAGAAYGSLTVSPWKCPRLVKALNLNHRQIVEAALIRAEAI